MACQHRSKVWVTGWCDVAHRYCTPDYESTCKYNKTNADSIRAMSDKELAEHFSGLINMINAGVKCDNDLNSWLDWLKQPVDVSED